MSVPQIERLRQALRTARLLLAAPRGVARLGYDLFQRPLARAPGVEFETTSLGSVPAERGFCPGLTSGRTILYLHGGGYVLGSARGYRSLASQIAARLGAEIWVLDYRLAPEHPYPAALEDVSAAYRALLDRGVPPTSLVLAGDSAGGGLALTALLAWRDCEWPRPAAAALLSPWTDLALTGASITGKAEVDPLLTREGLLEMARDYLGPVPPDAPEVSPLYAELTGLPPLLLQVGSEEILLDDSERFAAKARAAGVTLELEIAPGLFHVYPLFAGTLDESDAALDRMATFLAHYLPPVSGSAESAVHGP